MSNGESIDNPKLRGRPGVVFLRTQANYVDFQDVVDALKECAKISDGCEGCPNQRECVDRYDEICGRTPLNPVTHAKMEKIKEVLGVKHIKAGKFQDVTQEKVYELYAKGLITMQERDNYLQEIRELKEE